MKRPETVGKVSPEPIRIFFDTRERHWNQNPYISILAESLSPTANVSGFSWRRALLSKYEIAHFHWPEYLLVSESRFRRVAASVLFILMLARFRIAGTAVVQTMHDREPFVSVNRVHATLLGLLRRRTVARIWLNSVSQTEGGVNGQDDRVQNVVILHGDYEPWIGKVAPVEGDSLQSDCVRPGHVRLMCFGIMRPYKNFEQAAEAVGDYARGTQARLYIAGSTPDKEYLERLRRVADKYGSIDLDPRRLGDHELVSEIRRSTAVLVPYRDLYNSGVVFMSLSLGRPVIMRRNPITSQLREEYGPEWISLFDGELTATSLAAAIEPILETRGPAPKSPVRDAAYVSQRHIDFYRQVLSHRFVDESELPRMVF